MKRSRSRSGPTSDLESAFQKYPHSLRAMCRDAIISFGAGYGELQLPVERRITQYLRHERLFAVGGYDTYDGDYGSAQFRLNSRACFSFELSQFRWDEEKQCRMLKDRSQFGLVVFRGELWAVGGDDGTCKFSHQSCERLNARSSKWYMGPEMSEKRSFLAVAVLDGEIWAIGGRDGNKVLSSCEVLTNQKDQTLTWIPGPEMSVPRVGHQAAAFKGVMWIIDGKTRSTEYFDKSSNQWVRGPNLKLERKHFRIAVCADRLWVIGGMGIRDKFALSSTEFLDADSDTWKSGPSMLEARVGFGLAVLGGNLWVVGGGQFELVEDSGDGHSIIIGRKPMRSCEILQETTWIKGPDLKDKTFGLCCCVLP